MRKKPQLVTLQGEDENAVRRIFTDDVLTFFSKIKGLSVEGLVEIN